MTTTQNEPEALRARVLETLGTVIDPEIGLSIVELGLVYGVQCEGGAVRVALTMTTPTCPLGEEIRHEAQSKLEQLSGVSAVEVELVWEPLWTPARMSAQARRSFGWEP